MTDEQIFELAESNGYQDDFGRWNFTDEQLLDFVFEIQSAEREACAKVAESYEPTCDSCPSGVSNAIRARGEK